VSLPLLSSRVAGSVAVLVVWLRAGCFERCRGQHGEQLHCLLFIGRDLAQPRIEQILVIETERVLHPYVNEHALCARMDRIKSDHRLYRPLPWQQAKLPLAGLAKFDQLAFVHHLHEKLAF